MSFSSPEDHHLPQIKKRGRVMRKSMRLGFIIVLTPLLILAQGGRGKIRGVVTDQETGEALVGANVSIEGTSLGASTDLNGVYVVLAIPTGTYAVRVGYIGYREVVLSNIRVSENLTTSQDFQLSPSAIEVDALQIVAERPLIQRNTTNTVRITTQEDIKNMPVRGLQNLIALEAGTVLQDGELHIRGLFH
ncbi:MAG TPA: carboxypeptidase-like regulatory domain-containing protein [Candidatus Marinimicrobia bacterium]|nr:carboxypeptidase-like regulatory domain-containing protein [Candidatus Neomarinimicrobiota bacterium]